MRYCPVTLCRLTVVVQNWFSYSNKPTTVRWETIALCVASCDCVGAVKLIESYSERFWSMLPEWKGIIMVRIPNVLGSLESSHATGNADNHVLERGWYR